MSDITSFEALQIIYRNMYQNCYPYLQIVKKISYEICSLVYTGLQDISNSMLDAFAGGSEEDHMGYGTGDILQGVIYPEASKDKASPTVSQQSDFVQVEGEGKKDK